MFAVLKTGGKQYKVQTGDVLRVEKLAASAGEKVQFNDILMVGGTLGTPLVAGACVQAEVIDQIKADKAAATEAEKPAVGTRPANLLDAARDGQPDDLKLISGVGPKLEELLHENGVYHFDQIAAWKKKEIEYMDDQLAFHGRIEREEWIKQAKDLAKAKKD